MRKLLMFALVLTLPWIGGVGRAAQAQAAQNQSPQAKAATARPVNPEDEVVCHLQHQLGTLMMHRVCMTRRQWAQAHEVGREEIDRLQRSSADAGRPGGG